jgi:hypothetical protein
MIVPPLMLSVAAVIIPAFSEAAKTATLPTSSRVAARPIMVATTIPRAMAGSLSGPMLSGIHR